MFFVFEISCFLLCGKGGLCIRQQRTCEKMQTKILRNGKLEFRPCIDSLHSPPTGINSVANSLSRWTSYIHCTTVYIERWHVEIQNRQECRVAQVTCGTSNPSLKESCEFSNVTHLFQWAEFGISKLLRPTAAQKQWSFLTLVWIWE